MRRWARRRCAGARRIREHPPLVAPPLETPWRRVRELLLVVLLLWVVFVKGRWTPTLVEGFGRLNSGGVVVCGFILIHKELNVFLLALKTLPARLRRLLVKSTDEGGDNEVEHDEVEQHDQRDEEGNGNDADGALCVPPHSVPVLKVGDDEDSDHREGDRVEIGARWLGKLGLGELVSKELHAEQCENEDEEGEENHEVEELHERVVERGEQLAQTLPHAHESEDTKDAEKAEGSEDNEFGPIELGNDVDERDGDDRAIEPIKSV